MGCLEGNSFPGPSQAQTQASLWIESSFPGSWPASPFCGDHWPDRLFPPCVSKPEKSLTGIEEGEFLCKMPVLTARGLGQHVFLCPGV